MPLWKMPPDQPRTVSPRGDALVLGLPLGKGQVLSMVVAVSSVGWAPHRTQLSTVPQGMLEGPSTLAGCSGIRGPHLVAAPVPLHHKLASGQTHGFSNANMTGCKERSPTGHFPSRKAEDPLPCSIIHP